MRKPREIMVKTFSQSAQQYTSSEQFSKQNSNSNSTTQKLLPRPIEHMKRKISPRNCPVVSQQCDVSELKISEPSFKNFWLARGAINFQNESELKKCMQVNEQFLTRRYCVWLHQFAPYLSSLLRKYIFSQCTRQLSLMLPAAS